MQNKLPPVESQKISFYGSVYSVGCPACNRIEIQPVGLDIVFENQYFRVHQDYSLPIPFMMVIESKRHIVSISDLNTNESESFIKVLEKVRTSLSENEINEVTLVQDESSSHFHLWLLPIYPWMSDVTNGRIRNIQDIFDFAKANMKTQKLIREVEKATQKLKLTLSK